MNPLARLFGQKKIGGHDLPSAQIMPLIYKKAFLEGRANNNHIDVMFELFYRLLGIASLSNNPRIGKISAEAQNALVAACSNAADKGKLTIDASTDQKKAICAALDLLAQIAPQLTNETYFKSKVYAEETSKRLVQKVG